MPGRSGTIVTTDKKIYYYHFYHFKNDFLERNNIPLEYVSEGKKISDNEYLKITNFIEQEIFNKSYEGNNLRDSGWRVFGTYNNKSFNIVNDFGTEENPSLYNKTAKLLETII